MPLGVGQTHVPIAMCPGGPRLRGSMLAKARCQDQLGSQPRQGPGIFGAMWLGLLCLLGWFLWTRSLQDQLGSVPEEAELL